MFSPLFSRRFRTEKDALNWALENVHGPCVVWMTDWRHNIRIIPEFTPTSKEVYWDYGCYEPRCECPKS